MSNYYGRSSRGAYKTVTKAIIFWDNERSMYIIKTPPAPAFKNDLMLSCESATYLGATEGAWAITESDLNSAKVLLRGTFGEFDFLEKPEQRGSAVGNVNGAAGAALKIFLALGPKQSAKFMKQVAMIFHSDLNPNANDEVDFTGFMSAWSELKKELDWN